MVTIQRSVDCLRGNHINCIHSPDICACDCHQPGGTPIEDTITWLNKIIVESRVPSELLGVPADINAATAKLQLELLFVALRRWRKAK